MTVFANARPDDKPIYKIISTRNGRVDVNYENQGDALTLLWAYRLLKIRSAGRRLTPAETETYHSQQAALFNGEGI
jgi:hypothetical protein